MSSAAPQFKSINLRCSAFFIAQLSDLYMTTGKTIALTMDIYFTDFLIGTKLFIVSVYSVSLKCVQSRCLCTGKVGAVSFICFMSA